MFCPAFLHTISARVSVPPAPRDAFLHPRACPAKGQGSARVHSNASHRWPPV